MEPIEGIDLKELVKQCKVEFDEEKQYVEIDKKIIVLTSREVIEHLESLERRLHHKRMNGWMRPY